MSVYKWGETNEFPVMPWEKMMAWDMLQKWNKITYDLNYRIKILIMIDMIAFAEADETYDKVVIYVLKF